LQDFPAPKSFQKEHLLAIAWSLDLCFNLVCASRKEES